MENVLKEGLEIYLKMKIKQVLIQSHNKFNSCDDILSHLSNLFVKEGYETKVLNDNFIFWRKMNDVDYRKEAVVLMRKGKVMVNQSSANQVVITWNISVMYLLIFSFVIGLVFTFMSSLYFEIEFVYIYIILVLLLISQGVLVFYLKTRSFIKAICK